MEPLAVGEKGRGRVGGGGSDGGTRMANHIQATCLLLELPGASVCGSSVRTCVGRDAASPSATGRVQVCGVTREKIRKEEEAAVSTEEQ